MKTVVCRTEELGPGELKPAELGPIKVVVIRASDGTLSALAAKCLHQGGPLDKGRLYKHTLASGEVGEYSTDPEREVLKCPWHGYEYDIRNGQMVVDASRCLQTFHVSEDDGQVTVELQQAKAS